MLDPPVLQSGYYMIALVTTQELLIFAYVQVMLACSANRSDNYAWQTSWLWSGPPRQKHSFMVYTKGFQ